VYQNPPMRMPTLVLSLHCEPFSALAQDGDILCLLKAARREPVNDRTSFQSGWPTGS
jgi:hypothetical protein